MESPDALDEGNVGSFQQAQGSSDSSRQFRYLERNDGTEKYIFLLAATWSRICPPGGSNSLGSWICRVTHRNWNDHHAIKTLIQHFPFTTHWLVALITWPWHSAPCWPNSDGLSASFWKAGSAAIYKHVLDKLACSRKTGQSWESLMGAPLHLKGHLTVKMTYFGFYDLFEMERPFQNKSTVPPTTHTPVTTSFPFSATHVEGLHSLPAVHRQHNTAVFHQKGSQWDSPVDWQRGVRKRGIKKTLQARVTAWIIAGKMGGGGGLLEKRWNELELLATVFKKKHLGK